MIGGKKDGDRARDRAVHLHVSVYVDRNMILCMFTGMYIHRYTPRYTPQEWSTRAVFAPRASMPPATGTSNHEQPPNWVARCKWVRYGPLFELYTYTNSCTP